MGIEGASHAIKGAVSLVAKRAPESAGKAVGVMANTAEKAAGATKDALHSGADRLRGLRNSFAESFRNARTPTEVADNVNYLANGNTTPVETSTTKPNAAPEAGQNSTTAEGAEPEDKKTDEVDKAKAERQSKEKKFNENVTKRHQALVEQINKEYEQVEKDGKGYPTNEDKRNEYFDKCAKANTEARTAELKATLQRDFEEGNPPPNQKEDPEAFRKWLSERDAYMNAGQEAQQEAEEAAKKAESEAGQTKKQEKDESEDGKEKEEDMSASMSNAFRLAKELEEAPDDKTYKKIEEKIDKIHNANQKSSPKFKTKVAICKTILIARAVALMGALGVAGGVVEKASSASAS